MLYKVMTVCLGGDEDCWMLGDKRHRFSSIEAAQKDIDELIADANTDGRDPEEFYSQDDYYILPVGHEPDNNYAVEPEPQPSMKTETKPAKTPSKKSILNKAKYAVVSAERAELKLLQRRNDALNAHKKAEDVVTAAREALDTLLAAA